MEKEKSKTRAVAIAIPDDLLERIDAIAEAEDRSRSYVVRRWLLEAVQRAETERAPLLAMASSDNGRTRTP